MRAGLIGYMFCGKTTLFEAVSMGHKGKGVAAVPVPDPRFDALCAAVGSKKTTPATVEIEDDAAVLPDPGTGRAHTFTEHARRLDALIHVIREFESAIVPFHTKPDVERDYYAVEAELIIADLQLVENRLERLRKSHQAHSPGSSEYLERNLMEAIKPRLESGEALRILHFNEEETGIIKTLNLLSAKPLIPIVNCSETRIKETTPLEDFLCSKGVPVLRLCAEIEKQIAEMPPDDQKAFLNDLGIYRPAAEAVVRTVYNALDFITFFTVSDVETKAWPLRRGATTLKAAATVHTDFAKGFIRAEVVSFQDFQELGSLKDCYTRNRMRLEGKDYVVKDGDIIKIRHKL